LSWLPCYNPTNLPQDIISGLTVASLIIPQSLSYAQVLVKIPPVLGLVSCFIPQLIYGILGTSKQLSVGPEALISILVASSIREFQKWKDPVGSVGMMISDLDNIQPTALLCCMVGFFTLLLGMFQSLPAAMIY
jgi:MFS superfamily sulfate permease-like transporter